MKIINLENSVRLIQQGPIDTETIERLVKDKDFIAETEEMKKAGNNPPMSLLVYDDVLALGCFSTDGVHMVLKPYSDERLIDFIDTAFYKAGCAIRVIEKTKKAGKMFEALKPRTDLDCVKYDADTKILCENKKKCSVERYLRTHPVLSNLCVLTQKADKVIVYHLIFEKGEDCLRGKVPNIENYTGRLEELEKVYREKHPHELVVVSPLSFCIESVGHIENYENFSCIGYKYLLISTEKIFGPPRA